MLSLSVGEQVCGELVNRWKRRDSRVLGGSAPSANPRETHSLPRSSGAPGFRLTGQLDLSVGQTGAFRRILVAGLATDILVLIGIELCLVS